MKVKIGDTTYDSTQTPIMIICSNAERQQMADMEPGATKYCQYPGTPKWQDDNYAAIKEWMGELGETNIKE